VSSSSSSSSSSTEQSVRTQAYSVYLAEQLKQQATAVAAAAAVLEKQCRGAHSGSSSSSRYWMQH
jgi:hypothetical protein